MLVVKHIEVVKIEVPVQNDFTRNLDCNDIFFEACDGQMVMFPRNPEVCAKKYQLPDTVYGLKFKNVNGEYIYIGLSNLAQEVLGLPFNQFEQMRGTILQLKKDYSDLLDFVKNMKWLERLRFLFKRFKLIELKAKGFRITV